MSFRARVTITESVSEVRVFEQDAVVFLVNADGVLDRLGCAGFVHKVEVHIVDRALAVAA